MAQQSMWYKITTRKLNYGVLKHKIPNTSLYQLLSLDVKTFNLYLKIAVVPWFLTQNIF